MDVIVFAPRDENIVLNISLFLAISPTGSWRIHTSSSHKRDRTIPTCPFVHRLCRYHGASGTDRLALESNATSPLEMNLSLNSWMNQQHVLIRSNKDTEVKCSFAITRTGDQIICHPCPPRIVHRWITNVKILQSVELGEMSKSALSRIKRAQTSSDQVLKVSISLAAQILGPEGVSSQPAWETLQPQLPT